METVVVSDMHLSEAQPIDRRRPHWMAYKRREFFIDEDFARLLDHVEAEVDGPVELVLNGDIFDFDSITRLPNDPDHHVDWVGRLRGLGSEEWMSLFKMECIIDDHGPWFERVGDFARAGNRVVFIVGNHDVELHWPAVQRRVREALRIPSSEPDSLHGALQAAAEEAAEQDEDEPPASSRGHERLPPVVFCNWFYVSGGDTFISHGHQYDPNCVCRDLIDPLISVRGRPQVRIPFGDLAHRYLLNGMGYFNPHATENFIMSGGAYIRFFFRYMVRTQPLLVWTWFWGALYTLLVTLRTHWRPAMRDPLLVEDKVKTIAWRSRVRPAVVRQVAALNVASAATSPILILRELWLDRALLFLAVLYGAWQVVLLVHFMFPISPLWVLVPLALLLPPYLIYAASVRPTVFKHPLLTAKRAELIATITGAENVVFGHTHAPTHRKVGPIAYFNCGFWSPAFAEPECKKRIGTQSFVWIRATGEHRQAAVWEWPPGGDQPKELETSEPPPRPKLRQRISRKLRLDGRAKSSDGEQSGR